MKKLNFSSCFARPVNSLVNWLCMLAMSVGCLAPATCKAVTGVSEPDTIFYGRIINRSSGQVYQLYEGVMTWRIRRPDASVIVLSGKLEPLQSGLYSYRLSVPHEAIALGLEISPGSVALAAQPATCSVAEVRLNGNVVLILPPGSSKFEVAQATRASTFRLDLEVMDPLTDLDRDGIPDAWELLNGVDDPNEDTDGDGWTSLNEFLQSGSPSQDNRLPSIGTRELRAYADGSSTLMLKSVDSDSVSSNLIYTVLAMKGVGTLSLRNESANPANPDLTLQPGASFSQADVDNGRLMFSHPRNGGTTASLLIALRDENPTHPSVTGSVAIVFYRPAVLLDTNEVEAVMSSWPLMMPSVQGIAETEQPLAVAYYLSRERRQVVSDAFSEGAPAVLCTPSSSESPASYSAFVSQFGKDESHVLLGGAGADQINGSMESDLIIGGRGSDILRGNGGADVFAFTQPDDGNDFIADFNAFELDVVDISRLLKGTSPWASNYVRLAAVGTNTQIQINFSGAGTGYTNMAITLAGTPLAGFDLRGAVDSGRICTGTKATIPQIFIAGGITNASENGPVAGSILLRRTGSTALGLPVNLQITGSAVNGTDYELIPNVVQFLPGQSQLTIPVNVNPDAVTELTEVVDILVLPGNYEVAGSMSYRVWIEDLAPQISIETLEPVAVKSTLVPGYMLVSRAGVLDRSVLVRLSISGTAANSTDYSGVPNFINFQAWQTTALIEVTPKSTATLAGGVEFVQVDVRPDSTYRLAGPSSAQVILIDERLSFPLWRERYFGGVPGDINAFAQMDVGNTGARQIQRYAFGLDPYAPAESSWRPKYALRDGRLSVQFRKPFAVSDVNYVVEMSENLSNWFSGDTYIEPFAAPETANQPEIFSFRIKRESAEVPAMFLRVRPVYAP